MKRLFIVILALLVLFAFVGCVDKAPVPPTPSDTIEPAPPKDDVPVTPDDEKPGVTEQPSDTEQPGNIEQPGDTDQPSDSSKPNDQNPLNPDNPSDTENPSVPDKPDDTENPDDTERPDDPKPNNPENPDDTENPSEAEPTEEQEITTMYIYINDNKLEVTLAKNSAVTTLVEILKQGDITYTANDYGGFEKVGSLGHSLPTENSQITTQAGDVILYSGNQIVLFYGSNSWSYTRLGKINGYSDDQLRTLLGAGKGSLQVRISLK